MQRRHCIKEYLEKESAVVLNDNAIFDIQIKRLHEYKSQQMNVLYIIYKYLDIKAGNKPKRPITISSVQRQHLLTLSQRTSFM